MPDGLRARLGAAITNVAVFTDFDGVLAPLVDDPSDARPVAGAVNALKALRDGGATVMVVSGRPVAFLAERLGDADLDLVGLYGLEQRIDGDCSTHPEAAQWKPVVDRVADRALRELPDTRVEEKGVSLTLHYREAPERSQKVEAWAKSVAIESGLEMRSARQSVELHPPVRVDKGTSVRDHTPASASAVVYFGDDVGDLPAFDAVLEVAGQRPHLRVLVTNEQVPASLADVADVELSCPIEVVRFLSG